MSTLSRISGICLAVAMCLVMTLPAAAQGKKAKGSKTSNIQGTVQSVDKAKMTIAVKAGPTVRNVVYTSDTKFMMGHSKDNKPGSIDQVKDTNFISCSGTYAAGSVQLNATQCVYRDQK
jgi:hypothetical protein